MKTNTLASLAFLASILFPACQKAGDTPTPEPEPEVKAVPAEFLIVSTLSQREIIVQEFQISVNGNTVTLKDSEMTEIPDIASYTFFKTQVDKAITFMGYKTDSVKYFKGSLGDIRKGQKITGIKRTATIKSDRPAVETFDYFNGFTILVDGGEGMESGFEVALHRGIYNTDETIKSFFDRIFKDFPLDYTY